MKILQAATLPGGGKCVFRISAASLLIAGAAMTPVRGIAQSQEAAAPPASATSCAGCHGAHGEGNAAGGFPRIAGQSQAYLARQLASYADGSRNNSVMSPIAKGLSPQQVQEVTAYYAAANVPLAAPAKGAAQAGAKRGQQLATVGDEGRMVQACANCHGPGGAGSPPTYPYLAGQHQGYLAAAMAQWKNGDRKNDPSQQMPTIAHRLTDADVAAVSAYYAGLPAPGPWQPQSPAGSANRPAAPATPSAASTAGDSVRVPGVEQGQPNQGSTVGPGGAAASPSGK